MNNAQDTNNTLTSITGQELRITRIFHAPRELVFKAWTDPEHLPKWWGPKGFTNTVQEIDIRPGGVWRYVMHGPDGVDYDNKITYHKIVSPEQLVYSHGDDDEDDQFHVTVTFKEQANTTTELTMTARFKSAAELEKAVKEYGAVEGAKSTMDRLQEQLAAM
ncbi:MULTISPECIES: SRPBCC family protein [unclassified Paenibacillus]|uniref:SRPBCC family protein n=1 Tax=unclassified Paenibacillus TaxID=185978 RepID=UPI0027D7DE5B|nr:MULTISPECIES: SRPBCC family protein [unclassified Paenibacillus]